ncbi:hypothetical protein PV515_44780, partial [Streptomyces scabiei]|nr:hypothetical protein [Streptomyces scabiei]
PRPPSDGCGIAAGRGFSRSRSTHLFVGTWRAPAVERPWWGRSGRGAARQEPEDGRRTDDGDHSHDGHDDGDGDGDGDGMKVH